MSRTYAMIKFKRTGNIYMGCYNGTSDILIPFICTPEECYEERYKCYSSITYCQDISDRSDSWKFPDNITDLDEVEIYSDYGGGFYWPGTGSESIKMIKTSLDPFEQCYDEMVYGKPDWVVKFWETIENG